MAKEMDSSVSRLSEKKSAKYSTGSAFTTSSTMGVMLVLTYRTSPPNRKSSAELTSDAIRHTTIPSSM